MAWNEPVGRLESPYLRRWVLETPWFSLRLHRWIYSDDQRALHDHPWSFLVLILTSSYRDRTEKGEELLVAGSVRFRRAEHRHAVIVPVGGVWTLLATGPERREWGFWVDGRFRHRNKYFFEHGHH